MTNILIQKLFCIYFYISIKLTVMSTINEHINLVIKINKNYGRVLVRDYQCCDVRGMSCVKEKKRSLIFLNLFHLHTEYTYREWMR